MKGGRLYLLKISVPNSTVNTYLKLLPEISECFGGSFWWILVDLAFWRLVFVIFFILKRQSIIIHIMIK